MAFKEYLMIPGPTPIPARVMAAMTKPMIGHRGPEFSGILKEVIEDLKWVYRTQADIMILPSSGTGGMEAAVSNVLSPGDKALVANIGNFGNRWVKLLKAYGIEVIDLKFPWGQAVDLKVLEDELSKDRDKKIKAVFFQQNETSTGVLDDTKAVAQVIQKHGALIVVDAVSGLLTAPLETDKWGLDVVVAGSQKAFMVPPGLAAISMSQKAWGFYENSKLPKFYFDLGTQRNYAAKGQTFTTPPESIIFGMREALKMIKEEGLEAIFARHEKYMRAVRGAAKAVGLGLLASDSCASRAVTALIPPQGIDAEKIRSEMRRDFGVELAPGQGDYKGKIFRIGHLGYVDQLEIVAAISALEKVLAKLGHKAEIGVGVKAALKELE